MGWCSGTVLFDDIVEAIFDSTPENIITMLTKIITAFEDMDWDCQEGSRYWEKHEVRQAFKAIHPEWFEDDNEQRKITK